MYATLEDIRAEGVPDEAPYTDERVEDRLALAAEYIHARCRMWFAETEATLTLDGTGRDTLLLPMPLLAITSLTIDGSEVSDDDLEELAIRCGNTPGQDERRNPRLQWKTDTLFPVGVQNIVIEGTWGFVEGEAESYTTPRAIRDVCMRLAILDLEQFADAAGQQERREAQFAIRHAVHNRSIDLSDLAVSGGPTGIAAIDRTLERFRAPLCAGIVRRGQQ